MTYQVLARKWRPQDFSSLIGQQPIVTALRNGLAENRIAQAYLFSGIRGVGKTTAARILAKALNCERGPDPKLPAADPCNECPPCCDITAGRDVDFLEVDAATYSKVEQVRELTESLRYGPARDRYKVVVLDEVHRLSRQAFDALLKIVEEPPPHLVFIFATTEIDTVPATILSRCQEFQFRRVPSAVLAQYLRTLSDNETIAVSDAALRLIARAGEGSVRDSVALLDQLATFGSGTIQDRDAKDLLGGLDTAIFLKLLAAILDGRGAAISEIVREIEATGWDPHSTFAQFLIFARDALQLAMGGRPEHVDLPLEEAEKLAELVAATGYEGLLRMIQLLLDSESTVRRSELGMLAVQIAWLRAAELPKVARIEELLAGAAPPAPAGAGRPGPPRTETRGSAAGGAPPGGRGARARSSAAPPAVPAPQRDPQDDLDDGNGDGPGIAPDIRHNSVEVLMALLSSRSPALSGAFQASRDELAFADGKLQVPEGDRQLTAALNRPHNLEIFERLVRETWGNDAGWCWASRRAPAQTETAPPHRGLDGATPARNADAGGNGAPARPGPKADPGAVGPPRPGLSEPARLDAVDVAEARKDPLVQAVLEIFAGSKIHSVTTRAQGDLDP